ncbi:ankryin repeat protein [Colletotrichum musicola]|uniref:Ankryin repeat protein n=1 Tax=Colletotrichum musicola TaxID=2175873 RepID=A0A8H6MZW5_9PEZI|nr:ankryin repeat protein [Colletotrichum musicola]
MGAKADGLFKLVACQLDSLEDCGDLELVQRALSSLPGDLHKTYDRIFNDIPLIPRFKAIRLLQFLVYAERPLSLQEAVDVVATKPEGFKPEDRTSDDKFILNLCSTLVTVMNVHQPDGQDLPHLQLTHSSVRDYLLRNQIFQLQEAFGCITRVCLAYLSSINTSNKTVIKEKFALAEYAADFWMKRARSSETQEGIVESAVAFLENKQSLNLWADLLTTSTWAGTRSARRGHVKIVKLLLDHGASIDAKGGYYGTALKAACRWH